MSIALRTATGVLSPAGARAKLSIFIFHRVLEHPDPLLPGEPDASGFDRILGWISAQYTVVNLPDAVEQLRSGTLPARAASITFDDGYGDNFSVALPVLLRHRATASFFVATGYLQGEAMFNDRIIEAVRAASEPFDTAGLGLERMPLRSISERVRAIESILQRIKGLEPSLRGEWVERIEAQADLSKSRQSRLMMSPEQVYGLARAGMDVGGHTRTHPILSAVDDDIARREIESSRSDVKAITGIEPRSFAYPNGRPMLDFDERHLDMVAAAGYTCAVTTERGAATRSSNAFALPRFTPWKRSRAMFGFQSLQNLHRSAVATRLPSK